MSEEMIKIDDVNDEEFGEKNEVIITLEDGSEMNCLVLYIIEMGDNEYISLIPEEDIELDEPRIFVYRYKEDEDGNPCIENILDDDEYEAALEAFDDYIYEQELDD